MFGMMKDELGIGADAALPVAQDLGQAGGIGNGHAAAVDQDEIVPEGLDFGKRDVHGVPRSVSGIRGSSFIASIPVNRTSGKGRENGECVECHALPKEWPAGRGTGIGRGRFYSPFVLSDFERSEKLYRRMNRRGPAGAFPEDTAPSRFASLASASSPTRAEVRDTDAGNGKTMRRVPNPSPRYPDSSPRSCGKASASRPRPAGRRGSGKSGVGGPPARRFLILSSPRRRGSRKSNSPPLFILRYTARGTGRHSGRTGRI